MIKHLFSKFFSDEQLFDVLPSAILNKDGVLIESNKVFKNRICRQTGVGLKELLNIRTIDNQIFGTYNGINWILLYKYHSKDECKVWAVPELPSEPSIWSLLPLPMLIVQTNGRIKYVNEAFIRSFPDYMADDLIGKFCFAFDEKLLGDGKVHELIWKDSLCRVKIHQHSINLWLLTLENMTDLSAADSKSKESNYLRAMGQITSSVVHDFRNILSVVRGYCELILDGCDPMTMQNYVRQISVTVNNASDMVNELLKFNRTTNTMEMSCVPFEVLTNLGQIGDKMLGPMVKLQMNLKEPVAQVGLSSIDLERIVTNILINSRDAIKTDGLIKITLSKKYFHKTWTINNCNIKSGFYVVITIDDNGQGISPEDQDKVFSPFFTTKRHGSGLGLSTIMSILRDISGGIHLISTKRFGTRVSIYLPIIQAIANSTPRVALDELKTHAAPLANKNIIMVEDNPDVLKICGLALEKEGYNIRKYMNAEEALEEIRPEDNIDLLITDVNLPGMNGSELVSLLQKNEAKINSVLVISGYDSTILQSKFPAKTNFLSKPIPLSELKAKVYSILSEKHDK